MQRERPSGSAALDLAALWRTVPDRVPRALEGIHAALLIEPNGSWSVAADILGTMPVYYVCGPDYVLVELDARAVPRASRLSRRARPPRPRRHPADQWPREQPRTLARGETPRRGDLLHAASGQPPTEVVQYRPEPSDRYFGSSYDENFRRMEEVLDRCFDRHLPSDASYGMILSGGLDSRLVAGMAHERGLRVTAYSFGSRSDIEVKCAAAVANELALPHAILPIRMEHFVEYADAECARNHLANGFSGIELQEAIPEPQNVQAMLSGYTMETVIGADHTTQAGPDPARMSFDQLFRKINRWGLPVDTVKRLIRKSYEPALVDEVLSELEHTYRDLASRDFQRAWLFDQFHRERYHTSAVLGLHGRWPWPAVAYVDSEMMEVMGAMPYEHVKHRRMQYDLLRRRFPALARLPLDRNAFNMRPIAPRYGRVLNHVLFKPRELYYRWTRALVERRFYYRTMAFDSPGWNAVRAAAEAHRSNVHRVLDAAALAEVLPRPGEPFDVADGIIDTSKMKLMTGLLLWSARYL